MSFMFLIHVQDDYFNDTNSSTTIHSYKKCSIMIIPCRAFSSTSLSFVWETKENNICHFVFVYLYLMFIIDRFYWGKY